MPHVVQQGANYHRGFSTSPCCGESCLIQGRKGGGGPQCSVESLWILRGEGEVGQAKSSSQPRLPQSQTPGLVQSGVPSPLASRVPNHCRL